MISKRNWTRINIVAGSIFAILGIIDFITKKIGLLVPTVRFLWKILNQRVPVFVIVVLVIIAFVAVNLKRRKLTDKETFIISFVGKEERGLAVLFRAYKKRFPDESSAIATCNANVMELERKKLIEVKALEGGIKDIQDELSKLTKNGLKRYAGLDTTTIERAERINQELEQAKAESKKELRKEKVGFQAPLRSSPPEAASSIPPPPLVPSTPAPSPCR